jgi:hypothetical protein
MFDRESGGILERLELRPELGAFERVIRQRMERGAAFEDERFAHPRTVERDLRSGALVVISEFVAGNRLSDLLEGVSGDGCDEATAPGVDAALGFLLEVLPALAALHAATGFAHGAVGPGRTIVTPAGQVVLLDWIFAHTLERLKMDPGRLWRELGIASSHDAAGPFDVCADIAQAALAGVMIALGRPLRLDEYPDGLTAVVSEVVDIAQIRGSARFATGLQRFLHRALPLSGSRPFPTADEAGEALHQLVRDIGAPRCRAALAAFVSEFNQVREIEEPDISPLEDTAAARSISAAIEFEIALDEVVTANPAGRSQPRNAPDEEPPSVYTLPAETATAYAAAIEPSPSSGAPPEPPATIAAPPEPAPIHVLPVAPSPIRVLPPDPAPIHELPPDPPAQTTGTPQPGASDPLRDDGSRPGVVQTSASNSEMSQTSTADPGPMASSESDSDQAEAETPAAARAAAHPTPAALEEQTTASVAAAPPPPSATAPKKGRQRRRGAKRDRDKLRSNAKPAPVPAAPPPPRPAPIVPVAPPAMPYYPPVFEPRVTAPSPAAAWTVPAAPAIVAPPIAPPKPPPAPAAVRVKSDPPAGYTPAGRGSHQSSHISPLPRVDRLPPPEKSSLHWKLGAAAALLVAVGAGVVARPYLIERPKSQPADASARSAPAAQKAPPLPVGSLSLATEPAGARVLLDGAPAGETPLTIEAVATGRHTVTFVTPAGSVRKSVRIEAGKTVSLDVPVYSGWVAVFAPVLLDIAENGRSIGTTEQGRLMLSPGRHQLTFSNRELGYTSSQAVDIEPGEERSVNLQPTGELNLNALPWAEVWIDGHKTGDTPIANLRVPLGTHEIIFKHPQFGDRRVTATVRAAPPTAATIDFTKAPQP